MQHVSLFPYFAIVVGFLQATKVQVVTAETDHRFAPQKVLQIHPPDSQRSKFEMNQIRLEGHQASIQIEPAQTPPTETTPASTQMSASQAGGAPQTPKRGRRHERRSQPSR